MGTGEEGTPTKSSKPVTTAQEVSVAPTTPAYPDWSTSMQAFYGAGGTPPYFASTVASPTPHPYMWGQHPMMPPYGTPFPYPALYPPGGVYAHPNITTAPGTLHGSAEFDRKANEGKDRSSSKNSKGNTVNQNLIGAKIGIVGKATSGSGNDVGTQSAESRSDGSLDSSDDNHNQEFSGSKKGSFDQMLADGANAQNSGVPANFQTTVQGNPVGSVPAKNLNSGMEIWNACGAGSGSMKLRPNQPGIAAHGMMNDQWTQDERELKRQKRKQSNRESARRSRLRKQAECEELQHRVDGLNSENRILRDELQKLSEECEKLTSENDNMKEELTRLCGPEAVSNLENGNSDTQHESRGGEGKR